MASDLSDADKSEADAISAYETLMTAKKSEVEQQLVKQAPQMEGDDGETVLTDLRNGIAAISQLTRVVDDVMAMRKDYNTKQLTIRPRVVDNFSTVLRDLGNQYRAIV